MGFASFSIKAFGVYVILVGAALVLTPTKAIGRERDAGADAHDDSNSLPIDRPRGIT